jgi:predicted lipoprotein with Yx(FWY)xxD motif
MRKRFVALAVLALVFTGACAKDEDPALTATDEPAATEAASDVTVATADSDFGTILTDGDGRTLYVFLKDSDGKSACVDTCAETWPALEADGDPTASGDADEAELSTIKRDDGTEQVAYNDRPLYHFSGDTEDGDTKGQGIGENWFVVSPEGEPIKEKADDAAPASSEAPAATSDSGY